MGHAKDSLWSLDLFRSESVALQTYWVLVVMDQYTRRNIGFGIQRGVVDGLALCRMFNGAIHTPALPKYLSSDHDPLFLFQRWQVSMVNYQLGLNAQLGERACDIVTDVTET
jgi:hypothetical protein